MVSLLMRLYPLFSTIASSTTYGGQAERFGRKERIRLGFENPRFGPYRGRARLENPEESFHPPSIESDTRYYLTFRSLFLSVFPCRILKFLVCSPFDSRCHLFVFALLYCLFWCAGGEHRETD